MKKPITLICFVCLTFIASGQKVGVVLSGGGAHGLAHIGVLKALEENHIPVNYLTGTSMGAVVGGFYAAGYSPGEIEYIAQTNDFQGWVSGQFKSKYKFFFRKKEDNSSLISINLRIDSNFQTYLRTNLINDIPLNFALQQLLCQASANAHYDFDSLFVPFRCIVSNVISQEEIHLKKGSLNDALRGTMTVPYIYRPIRIEGKYVFDGGLYNNFPVNVMKEDFKPDIIIGSNVSSKVYSNYPFEKDDAILSRLFILMFLAKSDTAAIGKSGIYISPQVDKYAPIDFTQVDYYIKAGYDAAMEKMPEIKRKIKQRVDEKALVAERKQFISGQDPLIFRKITVKGVNSRQQNYVRRIFNYHASSVLTLEDIKKGYYKLVADDNFQTVYPKINFDNNDRSYEFELDVKPEKNFKVDFGGVISSKPINGAFLGLQYNFLREKSYTFTSDFSLGRFYEAIKIRSRVDFPAKIPYYFETSFTFNNWDYFKSSQLFLEDILPTFLDQTDRNLEFALGIPMFDNGKLFGKFSLLSNVDNFSQDNTFKSGDTLDKTLFNALSTGIGYEQNTLNYKQFASGGKRIDMSFKYFNGYEEYFPGSTSLKTIPQLHYKQWFKAHIGIENYFFSKHAYNLGYILDGVISNQPFFSTYRSSLIAASGFYPIIDSRTLFLQNFRATSYLAGGLINNFRINKNINLRFEAYCFQPYKKIIEGNIQEAAYLEKTSRQYYAGAASIVYNTPVAPISFSVNYYDDPKHKIGFLFNIGYLLFNKRSLD